MKQGKKDRHLLLALAWMVEQYPSRNPSHPGDPYILDNECMSAGQLAMEELSRHGVMEFEDGSCRFGRCTPEGRALLASDTDD